jgi:site-specific recombinase XerD
MNSTDTDLITQLFQHQPVTTLPAGPVSEASLALELDLVEDYFADQTLSKKTEKDRRYLLKRFLTWIHQEGIEHETVTVRQVKEWMEQHKWKNSLCVQTAIAIRLFSVWRFDENHPLAKLRIHRDDPGDQRTLNKAEVDRLLDYLDKPTTFTRKEEVIAIRNMAVFSLALEAGLRISELRRLALQELSIENLNVNILASFAHRTPLRQRGFSQVTAEYLKRWLAIRGDWAQKDCDKVFVILPRNPGGLPMTLNGMERIIYTFQTKTGLANIAGEEHELTEEEIKTLCACKDELKTYTKQKEANAIRNMAIFCLSLEAGLSIYELCQLGIQELSVEGKTVTILAKCSKRTTLRQQGFSHITADLLNKWLAIRGDWAQKDCNEVFVGIKRDPGRQITQNGMKRIITTLRRKTGLMNQTRKRHMLTEAEFRTLCTYGDNPTEDRRNEEARLRDRAILSVALDTGLRASELCHLEISRLSLEERRLQVMGKGGEWRKCVISQITVSRLSEWLAIRGDVARKDCNTVFVGLEINIGGRNTVAGKPMTRNSLFQVMQRLGKSTGMYLPVHSLRRTFATLAIRRGASTRLVQLQGGWKDIRLVQRYTQALSADDFKGYFPTEE